jgi:hypothetical protein
MDATWIIIGIIVIIFIVVFSTTRNKEGKIEDSSLTSENFLEELKEFEMKEIPNRKKGFTEKDVQDQLEKFFKKHFETVYREYALEGVNVKQIDFDLGKGTLGIEVKLAREIIHEASWDRAFGQLTKYAKKKYTNDNLIVLIAGTEEESDSLKVKEFMKDVKEIGCINTYVTVNKVLEEIETA